MSFPSKADREKCWASRDEFWKCLDDNNGSQAVCQKFRDMYENSCPSQWVKHFDRKREYLKFKDRIQKEGSRTNCDIAISSADDMDHTALLTGSPSGIGLEISSSGDNSLNNLLHIESHPTTTTTSTSSTSCTKIPSPRIFRRFQTFQPPTFT